MNSHNSHFYKGKKKTSLRYFKQARNLLSTIRLEVGKSPAEVFKPLAAAEYPSPTSSGAARDVRSLCTYD